MGKIEALLHMAQGSFSCFTVLLRFLSLVGCKYELWNVVFHMTWNVTRCVSYDMERNVSNISYETAYENGVSNSSNAMPHFMVIRIEKQLWKFLTLLLISLYFQNFDLFTFFQTKNILNNFWWSDVFVCAVNT